MKFVIIVLIVTVFIICGLLLYIYYRNNESLVGGAPYQINSSLFLDTDQMKGWNTLNPSCNQDYIFMKVLPSISGSTDRNLIRTKFFDGEYIFYGDTLTLSGDPTIRTVANMLFNLSTQTTDIQLSGSAISPLLYPDNTYVDYFNIQRDRELSHVMLRNNYENKNSRGSGTLLTLPTAAGNVKVVITAAHVVEPPFSYPNFKTMFRRNNPAKNVYINEYMIYSYPNDAQFLNSLSVLINPSNIYNSYENFSTFFSIPNNTPPWYSVCKVIIPTRRYKENLLSWTEYADYDIAIVVLGQTTTPSLTTYPQLIQSTDTNLNGIMTGLNSLLEIRGSYQRENINSFSIVETSSGYSCLDYGNIPNQYEGSYVVRNGAQVELICGQKTSAGLVAVPYNVLVQNIWFKRDLTNEDLLSGNIASPPPYQIYFDMYFSGNNTTTSNQFAGIGDGIYGLYAGFVGNRFSITYSPPGGGASQITPVNIPNFNPSKPWYSNDYNRYIFSVNVNPSGGYSFNASIQIVNYGTVNAPVSVFTANSSTLLPLSFYAYMEPSNVNGKASLLDMTIQSKKIYYNRGNFNSVTPQEGVRRMGVDISKFFSADKAQTVSNMTGIEDRLIFYKVLTVLSKCGPYPALNTMGGDSGGGIFINGKLCGILIVGFPGQYDGESYCSTSNLGMGLNLYDKISWITNSSPYLTGC